MPDKHARVLARAAVILFALSLVNGFLIHAVSEPRQALSAHLIGLIGTAILLGLATLWRHLHQSAAMSKAGVGLAIYGFGGGWLVNLMAALLGHFGVFPISAATPGGHSPGDYAISIALLSVALALFALAAVVFLGLGAGAASRAESEAAR
jgi:hydroxylaminobenzene mutase